MTEIGHFPGSVCSNSTVILFFHCISTTLHDQEQILHVWITILECVQKNKLFIKFKQPFNGNTEQQILLHISVIYSVLVVLPYLLYPSISNCGHAVFMSIGIIHACDHRGCVKWMGYACEWMSAVWMAVRHSQANWLSLTPGSVASVMQRCST